MPVIPHPSYLPDLATADFFTTMVEIYSEMSPISDERRKFVMGPTCYPTKHILELEKLLQAVNRQWRGVL
jgi:hypothetical protein